MSEDKMRETYHKFLDDFDSDYDRRPTHFEVWEAATKQCAAIKDAEIAALEHQSAVWRCPQCPDKKLQAEMEKMLLDAEIRVLEAAYCAAKPYGEEFGFMLTERYAKLAELNKE